MNKGKEEKKRKEEGRERKKVCVPIWLQDPPSSHVFLFTSLPFLSSALRHSAKIRPNLPF